MESEEKERYFMLLTRDLSTKERKELSRHFEKIVEYTDLYVGKTHINELPEFDLLLLDLRKSRDHQFLELIVDELKSFQKINVVFLKKKFCFDYQALEDVLEHSTISEVPLDVISHDAFLRYLKKKKLAKVKSRWRTIAKRLMPFLVCS